MLRPSCRRASLQTCAHCSNACAGVRLSFAHLVVLDGLFGESERVELLEHLTAPGWDHTQVPLHSSASRIQAASAFAPGSTPGSTLREDLCHLQGPPPGKWERETADGAGTARTWGLRDGVLHSLIERPPPPCWRCRAAWPRCTRSVTSRTCPRSTCSAGSLPQQERPGEGVPPPSRWPWRQLRRCSSARQQRQGRWRHAAPRQAGAAAAEEQAPAVFCAQLRGQRGRGGRPVQLPRGRRPGRPAALALGGTRSALTATASPGGRCWSACCCTSATPGRATGPPRRCSWTRRCAVLHRCVLVPSSVLCRCTTPSTFLHAYTHAEALCFIVSRLRVKETVACCADGGGRGGAAKAVQGCAHGPGHAAQGEGIPFHLAFA